MDVVVFESGNGGDVQISGNDVAITDGLFNNPYLGLFGGNFEQSTEDGLNENGLLRFDWWGNELFFTDQRKLQFNSEFERALTQIALTSSGRSELESIVRRDLDFMTEISDIEFEISIVGPDSLQLDIVFSEPDNLEPREFRFLWDGTKLEEIINRVI